MNFISKRLSVTLPVVVACSIATSAAFAQTADVPDYQSDKTTITVTPNKYGTALNKTGSAVSIISGDEFQKSSPASLVSVLREVPGLDIHESGGPGTATSLSLRGSSPGQTLVLVDGARIGDPSNTDGALDFSSIAIGNIDHIEVLRGPQSALYGSDAMGGVVNIITKTGQQKPVSSVLVEGGSYGTLHTQASSNGGVGNWTYALGIDALHSDSFAHYGYRISRPLTIGDGVTPLSPLPNTQPMNRGGVNIKLGYAITENLFLEGTVYGSSNHIRIDNPYALQPADVFSSYNKSTSDLLNGTIKLKSQNFDGALTSQFTVFDNTISRNVFETEACYDINYNAFNCENKYNGTRQGIDYQGKLDFAKLSMTRLGILSFGLRTELERASTSETPNPYDGSFIPITAHQTTQSAYVQHQIELIDHVTLTYAGRVDSVTSGKTFVTGRTTLAYYLEQTGTKLRTSLGTGAKTPTLYERFSQYGTAALLPEKNRGFDVGFDQKILGERGLFSATYFDSRYNNLINFSNSPGCSLLQQTLGGCYYNTSRAKITGVELAGSYDVFPELFKIRASYTFENARDLQTFATLLQRPRNKASTSLIYTPFSKLELEARITFSGTKLDYAYPQPVRLASYALLDLYSKYALTKNVDVFAKIDNVTNAHYQDVYNFGTAGRAYYGGVKVSW